MSDRRSRTAWFCIVYFLLHAGFSSAAAWFQATPGISIWYPPCGLALSLLVLVGPKYAPVVFAANLLTAAFGSSVHVWWSPWLFPAIITANYAGAAWLVRRFLGSRLMPGGTWSTFVFWTTVLGAPAVLAFFGTEASLLIGPRPPRELVRAMVNWWIGDASGLLTIVPVVMVFAAPLLDGSRPARVPAHGGRLVPALLLAGRIGLLVGSLALVFAVPSLRANNAFYICFLPLIWICLAHGLPGATLATLLVTMGGLIGLRTTASSAEIANIFLLFELAVAAVGLGLGTSVSRRNEAEAFSLEKERQMQLLQKNESLGLLAGGIAHDFNNLLTAIMGNANLARLDQRPGSPTEQALSEIEKASRRAADLCQQMLAYAGRSPLSFSDVDLNRLIAEGNRLIEAVIGSRIAIRFEGDPALAPITAASAQIQQIVMNLAINAAEAIGERDGTITIRTRNCHLGSTELRGRFAPFSPAAGSYVMLEVADTGCGMAPDVQARIFDPFFTTKATGHGLGLAAVMGIIKSHGGAIRAESEPGKGTTFQVIFPAGRLRPGGESHASSSAATVDSGLVLVVDDQHDVRATIEKFLQRIGFTPLLAADGREGVETFKRHAGQLRLVLLDLSMPRMDGTEALAEMRRHDPAVPVILMSGFSQRLTLENFTAARPSNVLPKPFDYSAFKARIEATLAAAAQAPSK